MGSTGSGGDRELAFPPGSTVQFKTALNAVIVGQVVCFDPTLKVLAVRDISGIGGKPILRMFNISMISEIKEIASSTESDSIENLFSNATLNPQQATDRSTHAESRRKVEIMDSKVSLDGQKAFVQLRRTLDDVRWQGENIIVLDQVLVKAPYTSASSSAVNDTSKAKIALLHVQKLLSKPYVAERRLTPCASNNRVTVE